MNEANIYLTDLIIGAEACLENSERLLSDSQLLVCIKPLESKRPEEVEV